MNLWKLKLHLVGLLVNIAAVTGSQVRNVYWNTTTASFSDKPLIVTVNEGNLPWEYDQLNLICPTLAHGDHGDQADGEQHVIYSVEKEEFDNCRVSSPRPRIVAVCNRPDTFMYFTITFRSFTPTPGGLEFRPGQEYYFISTANSRDIHRRVGGWCKSHNMKMIVKVADNEIEQSSNTVTHQRLKTNNLQNTIQETKVNFPPASSRQTSDYGSRVLQNGASSLHKEKLFILILVSVFLSD